MLWKGKALLPYWYPAEVNSQTIHCDAVCPRIVKWFLLAQMGSPKTVLVCWRCMYERLHYIYHTQIMHIDKKCMWKYFTDEDLSRVDAIGEWDNVWRCSAKTPPTQWLWDWEHHSVSLLFYLLSLWKRRAQHTCTGWERRDLEKVVDESKQDTIKERFPRGGSQLLNLNRSLNDTTISLNLLLLLPGRADSNECLWFPPSCSTPVSQQGKIGGLNLQLVKISAATMKLLERLCTSAAEKHMLFWRSGFGL